MFTLEILYSYEQSYFINNILNILSPCVFKFNLKVCFVCILRQQSKE